MKKPRERMEWCEPAATLQRSPNLEPLHPTSRHTRAFDHVGPARRALRLEAAGSPDPVPPRPRLPAEDWLHFSTARRGRIRVALLDARGRLVRTLVDEVDLRAGDHEVPIDGRDGSGAWLRPGVYLYRIESGETVATGSFVLPSATQS